MKESLPWHGCGQIGRLPGIKPRGSPRLSSCLNSETPKDGGSRVKQRLHRKSGNRKRFERSPSSIVSTCNPSGDLWPLLPSAWTERTGSRPSSLSCRPTEHVRTVFCGHWRTTQNDYRAAENRQPSAGQLRQVHWKPGWIHYTDTDLLIGLYSRWVVTVPAIGSGAGETVPNIWIGSGIPSICSWALGTTLTGC